jgi:hypothetical protein
MYKIIDDRGAGKTSRLMLLAKENKGIIVCLDPQGMKRKALGYGIVGLEFMSYYDFLQPETKFVPDTPIYIDDLDVLAQYITYKKQGYLDGYTISKDL